jgi:hypothetical protein
MVTLLPPSDGEKKFSKVICFLIVLFHRFISGRPLGGQDGGLLDYSSSYLVLFMQVLTAVFSSLFLMISVVVLYLVYPAWAPRGIIGAFTVIFSLSYDLLWGQQK